MLSNAQTYNDMWQNCLDRIKAQTSEEEFAKWFQPIVPLEFDGTTLRLRVPNASYVDQIEKNYIPFLRPIISQLYGQQTRLYYAVPKADTSAAAPRHRIDPQVQRPQQYRKYKGIQSVCDTRRQETENRPAAEPQLHVRHLHRRGVQPPGPLGRRLRGREPGQQPVQPAVYIR